MEQDTPIEHVVEYLVACIAVLAEGFGISMRSAYEYLDQFGGSPTCAMGMRWNTCSR